MLKKTPLKAPEEKAAEKDGGPLSPRPFSATGSDDGSARALSPSATRHRVSGISFAPVNSTASAPIQRVKFHLANYSRGSGESRTPVPGFELDTAGEEFATHAQGKEGRRIRNELRNIANEGQRRTTAMRGRSHKQADGTEVPHYETATESEMAEAREALDYHFPAGAAGGAAKASHADEEFRNHPVFQANEGETQHEAFYRNIDHLTRRARSGGPDSVEATEQVQRFLAMTDPTMDEHSEYPNARHNRAFMASRVRVPAEHEDQSAWGSGMDELLQTADTREFIRRDAGLAAGEGVESTSKMPDGESELTWMDVQQHLRASTDSLLWAPEGGPVGSHTGGGKDAETGGWRTEGQPAFHQRRAEAVLAQSNPLDAAIAAMTHTIEGSVRPEDVERFREQGFLINSRERGNLDESQHREALAHEVGITREAWKRRLKRLAEGTGREVALSPVREDPRGEYTPSPEHPPGRQALRSMAEKNPVDRYRNRAADPELGEASAPPTVVTSTATTSAPASPSPSPGASPGAEESAEVSHSGEGSGAGD